MTPDQSERPMRTLRMRARSPEGLAIVEAGRSAFGKCASSRKPRSVYAIAIARSEVEKK
ncbi:hypothetical protein [Amycolatopsis palatopharyngis]|uniref:hypothetical protein n=1 Tax=Amycolatopsis palatopharyngis TaxID=187982 RepID=UPI0013BEA89C|nr:hypothetical protein [Amycolatopsis palatopharyngis]